MRGARRAAAAASAVVSAAGLAGCFSVRSPDLFLLTRTGQGRTLTLVVNDSGTIRCDGGSTKPISNSTLISARDLSDDLADDATAGLTIRDRRGSVYYFKIKLQQGTVSFPDKAAAGRKPLAEAELFAAQAAQRSCGLSG